MDEDIVTRMRLFAANRRRFTTDVLLPDSAEMMLEGAQEIETLRQEVEEWKAWHKECVEIIKQQRRD